MQTEELDCEFHYSDERDDRYKETAEVFTPRETVQKMLDTLGIDWDNPPQDKKFLDPTCGSGNFLVELAKRGIPINMIYGLDIMQDNVDTTRRRLREIYGSSEDVEFHLNRNIIQGDALTDTYEFYEKFTGFEDW